MKAGNQPIQGTRRGAPVSLKLGFSGPSYGYAMDLGLPIPSISYFSRDPEIKLEAVWASEVLGRTNTFVERRGPTVRIRKDRGEWSQVLPDLASSDSMMTHGADPHDAVELLLLRERIREWRFYDHLRTDRDAPARRPQVGTYTPVLASDGADVAAARQTITEVGDVRGLTDAVEDAFRGARLEVRVADGYFELEMYQRGLLRPLKAAELSDGTLRYLLLVAALLSPRPPEFMVLNEPETSLHPDLLVPLARLIGKAAERSQIILVSHAKDLMAALRQEVSVKAVILEKRLGETIVANDTAPVWKWPVR